MRTGAKAPEWSKNMPELVPVTIHLPRNLWELVRAEKTSTGRAIHRIVADILSSHYAAEIEP